MIKETQLFLPFLENLSKQILEIYNSDFSHEIKSDNSQRSNTQKVSIFKLVKY